MAEFSYKKQTDLKNIEKIREHLKELPAFCMEYFRSLEIRKSSNTRKNYAYDLGVFFYFLKTNNPYFADKDITKLPIEVLDMITPMDIEEYLSFLEAYKKNGRLYTNKDEGKARKLSSLTSFYDYYFKRGLIKTNPTRMVDVPKIKGKNIIRLEPGEVAQLLDEAESGGKLSGRELAFHEKTKSRDMAILTLLLGTGIRVSECVGLDLDDVDFDNQAITIIDSEKTTIDGYYRQVAQKYFPDKKFKTITLPFWVGKMLGFISTTVSNLLKLRDPLFDPTFYAVHHVSSNLDFSSKKMERVIEKHTNRELV